MRVYRLNFVINMLKSYSEHTYFVFEMTTPILQSLDYPSVHSPLHSGEPEGSLEISLWSDSKTYNTGPGVIHLEFS